MERFSREFEILASLDPRMPRSRELALRLLSVRWPRQAWYRRWRYRVEKTTAAFDALTRESSRLLQPFKGRYDLVIQFGAVFAPVSQAPLFVFTDYCRWLSSRNREDEISQFSSKEDEAAWLAREGGVYRAAARVFVGSNFVRQALIEHYGAAPERVVAAGFGAWPAFAEPYAKAFDGRTILFIGKGDFEKKGGIVLLRAFTQLRHAIPDAVLHVVGQDRLPAMQGLINHGFTRERSQLVRLMRAAHVFTLPSLVDRNPISVLEAMAAGTPCVVSDHAAIPELVGAGGVVVPAGDADALAAALLSILRDPVHAARLGGAGRARFETHYDWDRVWTRIRAEMLGSLGAARPGGAA